jgi:hypothetical protein
MIELWLLLFAVALGAAIDWTVFGDEDVLDRWFPEDKP